jgi:CheY-like chemotaxis protein
MTEGGISCKTILVVDDSDETRLMLRRALEARGFCVAEAADGREAVELARRECPALIVMDLNMPRMDGLEATQRIRECKELCRAAPILAVTAFDTYGIKEAALEAGCNAYVRKPFGPGELERLVEDFLPAW